MAQRYQLIPMPAEARQVREGPPDNMITDELRELAEWCGGELIGGGRQGRPRIAVECHGTYLLAREGDWILQYTNHQRTVVTDEYFRRSFEPVEDEEAA